MGWIWSLQSRLLGFTLFSQNFFQNCHRFSVGKKLLKLLSHHGSRFKGQGTLHKNSGDLEAVRDPGEPVGLVPAPLPGRHAFRQGHWQGGTSNWFRLHFGFLEFFFIWWMSGGLCSALSLGKMSLCGNGSLEHCVRYSFHIKIVEEIERWLNLMFQVCADISYWWDRTLQMPCQCYREDATAECHTGLHLFFSSQLRLCCFNFLQSFSTLFEVVISFQASQGILDSSQSEAGEGRLVAALSR